MTYKDPKAGIIDLSSEELPKSQKAVQIIMNVCAFIYGGIGVCAFFGLLSINFFVALLCGAICGAVAWLCVFFKKKSKEKYYQNRAEILKKIANGELNIDVFDEKNFRGIMINNTEVGTNLLGWVRGVDQMSGTTPVSAKFTFTNKTGKAIKYITLGIRPYNAVGDPVACTVSEISMYECKCTGPFEANGKYTQTLENGWYNPNIASVKIESAEIIYMDNSTEILDSEHLKCLPKNSTISDNDSRIVRGGLANMLWIIAGIIDVISIIGVFTIDSTLFGVLTAISTIAFFVGLKLKFN